MLSILYDVFFSNVIDLVNFHDMYCFFQDAQAFPGRSTSGHPALQKPEKNNTYRSYYREYCSKTLQSMLVSLSEVSESWMTRPSLQGSIYGVFIKKNQHAL